MAKPAANERTVRFALLIILLLAFALRMARTGELRMWGDEAYSVYSAQRPLAAITFEGAENDPHPPLYYYLLHFYLPLAGASEVALRFFSVLPGLLSIALLYPLGRRVAGPRVGIAAAALAAGAPFHIYYSQEIRMYALAMGLTTLALYLLLRLWQRPSRSLWLGYGLATLLALYTLYHTAFILLAEGLVLLAWIPRRRAWVIRWFAVSFGAVALFLPWLLLRFSATLGHLEERAGHAVLSLPLFAARGFAALTLGGTLPPASALALSAPVAAILLMGLLLLARRRSLSPTDLVLLSLAVVPILAVYPLYLLLPILVGRLFALAFVPLVLVLARSVTAIGATARPAAGAALLLLAGLAGYALNDYYFRFDRYNPAAEDYIPVVRAVEQSARPGDVILFHARWQIGYFLSHYRGPPIEYRALDNQQDMETAAAQPRNLWAIVQGLGYHDAEAWLTQHAFYRGEQDYGQMRLLSYRAGTPGRGERFSSPVLFDNGMTLLGYRLNSEPLESGRDSVTLELDWQAGRAIPEDWTVSTRLVRPAAPPRSEAIFAQEDQRPVNGLVPTTAWQTGQTVQDRHALAIPAGTPPGNYMIQIVAYASSSGRAASIVAPENLRAQSLALGAVSITRPSRDPLGAPPAVLPPQGMERLTVSWNDIALLGLTTSQDQAVTGDTVALTLYWQARTKPAHDYAARIQWIDAAGVAHAPLVVRPTGDSFPTTEWEPGETWVDKIQLKVDAQTAPGSAALVIGLYDWNSGQTVVPQTDRPTRVVPASAAGDPAGWTAVTLAALTVQGREHRFTVPPIAHPLNLTFGTATRLLGYDLASGAVAAGQPIRLTLFWQALAPLDERYVVFVHLTDADGRPVAQRDSEPDGGRAPTTSWLQGEVIVDASEIELPAALPPGDYALEVGLYQPATGRRLPLTGASQAPGADRATLERIRTGAP